MTVGEDGGGGRPTLTHSSCATPVIVITAVSGIHGGIVIAQG